MIQHRPVMLEEVLEHLDVHSQYDYIDCTLGGGGYSRAILERNGPKGRVLAIDADVQTIQRTSAALQEYKKRFTAHCGNFRTVAAIAATRGFENVSGIIYDLGLSSDLLQSSGRGFSFLSDEPLDMRFSTQQDVTAAHLVNSLREEDLADILWSYGQERYSRRIAKGIVQARRKEKIISTRQLCLYIASAVPSAYRHGRIHCATRTFQALRIAVNDELAALEESLSQAWQLLGCEGHIVVVTFHSLEDRIVKHLFKTFSKSANARLCLKKPLQSRREEQRANPRSRSAKLRCIQKTTISP